MKKRIYLDNNATTFVDARVAASIYEYLKTEPGNPSSIHSFGREARSVLQKARSQIAQYLKVQPNEIIFTSGGTEGMNTLIRGLLENTIRGHVVTSSIEHSCVYGVLQKMKEKGLDVSFLSPGLWGAVTPEAVEEAILPNTKLIVLMAANNETGVRTDLEKIAKIAALRQIPFVVDAVALMGKEDFQIPVGVSAMCFSGHKFHAPTGVGIVFVKNSFKVAPMLIGGGQEYQRRGGTENLPGIVGVAKAMELLYKDLPEAIERMRQLRDLLEKRLLEMIPGSIINGEGPRVSNVSNISFSECDGESLLLALDREGIAVSHGSACSSGALEPSRVLLNMGLSRLQARSSLRISLSRFTTEQEIHDTVEAIGRILVKK